MGEEVVNKAMLDSDSTFCAVPDPQNAEKQIIEEDMLRITVSTPSQTTKSLDFEKVENAETESTDDNNVEIVEIEDKKLIKCEEFQVDEPMFIQKNGWKKENILEYLKADNNILEFLNNASSIDISAASSIDIPSLENLVKSKDMFKQKEIKQNEDLNTSTDGIKQIMKQLKALEATDILLNDAKDLIDLQIVFDDEENNEMELPLSSFPIPCIVKIDLDQIITDLYPKKQRINSNPTPPIEKKQNVHLAVHKTPDSMKKSPRKIKLEKTLKKRIENKPNDEKEIDLLLDCFANNLSNFGNSAKQLHSLSLLLKMKNLSREQMKDKIKENKKLKDNLDSIYESIEWIRDIIIDSHYSHKLLCDLTD